MSLQEAVRRVADIEGLYLSELSTGDVVLIRTQNSLYLMTYRGFSAAEITKRSPVVTKTRLVNILGSTRGGTELAMGFLGIGMRMEFERPEDSMIVITSRIASMRRLFAQEGNGDS